jgi:hypothetical protein
LKQSLHCAARWESNGISVVLKCSHTGSFLFPVFFCLEFSVLVVASSLYRLKCNLIIKPYLKMYNIYNTFLKKNTISMNA